MTKITLEKLIGKDFDAYIIAKNPSLEIKDSDSAAEKEAKLADLEKAKTKETFVEYLVGLGLNTVEAEKLYATLFEATDFSFSKISKLSKTEKLELRDAYEAFCVAISKYVEPVQSQETFNHFLETNGFDIYNKKNKLTKNAKNLYNNVTVNSPFASDKNHPKSSFAIKKVIAPITVGSASFLISNGILNASNLAAGSNFAFIPVTSTAAVTSVAIATVATIITAAVTPTLIKVKDKLVRHHYNKKYGKASDLIAGKETELEELMQLINERSADIQKRAKFSPIRYFKTKTNRNALHHIVNVCKDVVAEYKKIEAAGEFDGKKEKLEALSKFLTKVYTFAEDNLNIARAGYKLSRTNTLENIDIFARLAVICDDSKRVKAKDIKTKNAVETDIFYNGISTLAKFTSLSEEDLEKFKARRLENLPDNLKLAVIEHDITHKNLLAKLVERRKLNATEYEYRAEIRTLSGIQAMINKVEADSELTDDDKAKLIERILKNEIATDKLDDELKNVKEDKEEAKKLAEKKEEEARAARALEVVIAVNKFLFKRDYEDVHDAKIIAFMQIKEEDFKKPTDEFATYCEKQLKKAYISSILETLDEDKKKDFNDWAVEELKKELTFEEFKENCNKKLESYIESKDLKTLKRKLYNTYNSKDCNLLEVATFKAVENQIDDDDITLEAFEQTLEKLCKDYGKKLEYMKKLEDNDKLYKEAEQRLKETNETYEEFEKYFDAKLEKITPVNEAEVAGEHEEKNLPPKATGMIAARIIEVKSKPTSRILQIADINAMEDGDELETLFGDKKVVIKRVDKKLVLSHDGKTTEVSLVPKYKFKMDHVNKAGNDLIK